jgi:Co/Zn/Cd efflux system component
MERGGYEHAHRSAQHDNNMRAAVIHVIADDAVSVLVIVGLLLVRANVRRWFCDWLSRREHLDNLQIGEE